MILIAKMSDCRGFGSGATYVRRLPTSRWALGGAGPAERAVATALPT